jgi:hypothetical protein
MRGRHLTTILLCLALLSCGQARREELNHQLSYFVGSPITEVIIKLGPPIASFEVGPNQKAFQWYRTGSYTSPGTAVIVADTLVYNNPQQVTTECRLTFVAVTTMSNPQLPDWKIRSYEWTGAC